MRASVEPLWQVNLKNGRVWTGTEQELRRDHPTWMQYARAYQPHPHELTTREEMEAAGMDFLDDPHPGRFGNSARRYPPMPGQAQVEYEYRDTIVQTRVPPRRSAQRQPHPNRNQAQPPDVIHAPAAQRETEEDVRPRRRSIFHAHPLLWLGFGMVVALLAWYGLIQAATWWTDTQNDWTYTEAFRTYSVNMVVGHNHDSPSNPSHFIVQNDNRHVVIIELPADDAAKALIYVAPTIIGDGGDKIPVTLSFQRNLQTGRLDMVLHVADQQYVFPNNGTKFVPPSGQ